MTRPAPIAVAVAMAMAILWLASGIATLALSQESPVEWWGLRVDGEAT